MAGQSMKGHQPQASKNVDWITPRWILDPLGKFDLDPCASDPMPWKTADRQFTKEEDGLSAAWTGRVWLNPPFDKYSRGRFLRRMAEHRNGIALIPLSPETTWFRELVWPSASSLLLLRTRPFFHRPDGSRAGSNSGCSICLVGYGEENDYSLQGSDLGIFLLK